MYVVHIYIYIYTYVIINTHTDWNLPALVIQVLLSLCAQQSREEEQGKHTWLRATTAHEGFSDLMG